MTLYQKVKYINPNGSVEVPPITAPDVYLLPNLFQKPITFKYNTYAGPGHFAALDEGLLSILACDSGPNSPYGNYVDAGYRVITKPDGTMSPLKFAEAMAALCSYGTVDEGQTTAQLSLLARTRPLELRCGFVTKFVNESAPYLGITARQMHLLNVTANNFFDDGHVLSEFIVDGKQAVMDIPNDCAWEDCDGNLLSLKEVIEAGVANCTPRKLAQFRVGRNSPPWVPVISHQQFGSEEDTQLWCNRIYEVPGVGHSGGIVWGLPDHLWSYKAQVEAYAPGWTVLSWADWIAAYY
jgi:hypothetical protein